MLLPSVVTLSEAKGLARGAEMLHGVYTERSECAQHDSAIPDCRALARRERSPSGQLHCSMVTDPFTAQDSVATLMPVSQAKAQQAQ
jgi:hypothetical protein